VSEWRDQAAAESKLRQHAEEEVSQLKDSIQQLQLEAQNSGITAEYFRNSIFEVYPCPEQNIAFARRVEDRDAFGGFRSPMIGRAFNILLVKLC
jgi:hypothetical protein